MMRILCLVLMKLRLLWRMNARRRTRDFAL
jgi:hypothetical protein